MATSPFQSVLEEQKKTAAQTTQTAAPTQFRDDINKQNELASKERIATTNALSKAMTEATKATQQGFQTADTSEQPPAFQAFQQNLQQQAPQAPGPDQLREATTQKIIGDLSESPTALSTGSQIQLADLGKSIQEADRAAREQAIKTFGSGTGQVSDALRTQGQRGVLAEADLRGRLRASEEQAQEARQAQALSSGIQLLGQEQQATQFGESQALEREILAQQAGQFGESQGLERERIAEQARQFGESLGLSQEELAERQRQFGETLGFDKEQLAQQESQFQREQVQQKELTELGIDHDSRMQLSSQDFQASEAELDRTLQTLSQDKQILAQQNLQQMDQEFNFRFQEQGFLNQQDLQEIDNAFQSQLQQAGFDQQTATLLTQLNHDKMEAANDRAFSSEQSDLDRSWRTGERIGSEEFQRSVQSYEQAFEASQNELNRTLQLDVQENQFAFENARQEAEQVYNDSVLEKNMTHEEAMAESNRSFQSQMQQAGFDQDQILQGQQLTQEMSMFERELDSRESQFAIQLAQEDEQFLTQMGLDNARIELTRDQLEQDMSQFSQQFGLQEQELNAALERQDVQDKLEATSIAMEFLDDDDQALAPFVESMFGTLGKELGWTSEQIESAIATTKADTPPGGGGSPTSFNFDDMDDKEFFDNLDNPNFIENAIKQEVVEPFNNAADWTTGNVGDLKDILDGEARGFITINNEVYRLIDTREGGGFPSKTTLSDTGKSYETISLQSTDENGKPIGGKDFQIFLTGDKKGKATKGGIDFVDVKDFKGI